MDSTNQILIVGGAFTGSGTISCKGGNGGYGSHGFYGAPHGHGNHAASSGGGGAGGGKIWILRRTGQTNSFSGTISANGGTGGGYAGGNNDSVSSGSNYGDRIHGAHVPHVGGNGANGTIINTTID